MLNAERTAKKPKTAALNSSKCSYTQMNSKVGFWPRQLGSKFLVFTRALLFSNGRSLQTQKLAPPPCQNSNF